MLHQIWLSAEKNPRSAELKHTFCEVEFRWKNFFSAEILGQNIESAEVHYTKPEDGFRPNIGLKTKFRRENFFSAEVRYTICVVEFRRKTNLDQSPRNGFRDTGFQFSAEKNFFQQISCPIIRRNGKIGPQSLHFF